jgi:Rhodopirellula transposase DDE domain
MGMSLRMVPADQRDRLEASLAGKWAALKMHLDERSRRLWLGAEARDLGYGGVAFVAGATGVARDTIKLGVAELEAGPLEAGRVRREGAGRKKAADAQPDLASELDALVEPGSRGDPCSPLRWTTLSLVNLSEELGRRGLVAGPTLIGRLLRQLGYSLQANSKTREGRQHPDRDGQFRYINDLVAQRLAAGEPVISMDVKKKENIGDYKNAGTEWRPGGDPLDVDAYDFIGPGGKAVPHGIYDIGANTGWMTVGISADTSEFAVSCLLGWWDEVGMHAYPDAATLTITADCGGSNSSRGRLWKKQLARFTDQTGVAVTVLHYPPGTSKWNKIEHRMFSFVSMNWRARPLTSLAVIINTIGAVTTKGGLTITARLDPAVYHKGIKISDKEMKQLEADRIDRHHWHGEWNYTITPFTTPNDQN